MTKLICFVLIVPLLSACMSQADKGYEFDARVPVNGELIFH